MKTFKPGDLVRFIAADSWSVMSVGVVIEVLPTGIVSYRSIRVFWLATPEGSRVRHQIDENEPRHLEKI
jgi:hypothetical protein